MLSESHIDQFIKGWQKKHLELTSIQISYNHRTKEGFMYSKGYRYPNVDGKVYQTVRDELTSLVQTIFKPLVRFLRTSLRIDLEVDADGMIDRENISIIADMSINKRTYGGVFEFLRDVTRPYIQLADFIENIEIVGNNNMMGRFSVYMNIDASRLLPAIQKKWGEKEQRLRAQWMTEMARVIDYCESEYRFSHTLPVRNGELFFEKHFEHMGMKLYFEREEHGQLPTT